MALQTAIGITFPGLPDVELPVPDRPVVNVKRSEFDAFLLARSDAEVLERVAISDVAERHSYQGIGRRVTVITNAFLTRFGYQTPNSFGGMAGMR